jgi:hypothetical protein
MKKLFANLKCIGQLGYPEANGQPWSGKKLCVGSPPQTDADEHFFAFALHRAAGDILKAKIIPVCQTDRIWGRPCLQTRTSNGLFCRFFFLPFSTVTE